MALNPQLLLPLCIANLAILVWVARLVWQQRGFRLVSEDHLRRVAYRQADLVIFAESHQQLLEAQEILESSIHGTTATVRALHLGIASIPFGILEAIPVTRDTTKVVRGTHNLISDVVYSGISVANKAGGNIIRKGIGEIPAIDATADSATGTPADAPEGANAKPDPIDPPPRVKPAQPPK